MLQNFYLFRSLPNYSYLLVKIIFLVSFTSSLLAQEEYIEAPKLPRLEIGIGAAQLFYPDYPGAEQITKRFLAFPYVFFRGDWLETSRDGGLRSRIFSNAKIDLSLSFGGSLPVNASENRAREGMEDLDWIYEIGPSLVYIFETKKPFSIQLRLPLRLVSSTNFKHTQERGVLFNPSLVVRQKVDCKYRCFFQYQLNGDFASSKLHRYFYEVKPEYVTADRAAYSVRSGNLSYSANIGYRVNVSHSIYGVSLGYNYYGANANTDSPLLKQKHGFSAGLFWAWTFWQSET